MQLRPTKLTEIIGQSKLKQRLSISIQAAIQTHSALPHSLYVAQAGLGKTTFATATANELNADIQIANGGNLQSIKSLLPYLMRATEFSVLFIDEIHRMKINVQEYFYPIMEDFRVDLGKAEQVSVTLPPFTIIGATTHIGLLTKPLRDRFVSRYEFDEYTNDELAQLACITAAKYHLNLPYNIGQWIAQRGRGTPRIVNNLVLWLRDWCITHRINEVTLSVAQNAMKLLEIDDNGLNKDDHQYLQILRENKHPVGINTLCSLLDLPRETIESTIEPFLLRTRKIIKTTKGRTLYAQ